MLQGLRQRTRLPVKRVEIGRLNLLNDTAELVIFYDEPRALRWRRHDDTVLVDRAQTTCR